MSLEMVAPSTVNSSSASSLGSSSTPRNETAAENLSSRSRCPPLVQPRVGATVSGFAGKRPRSPQPSVSPRKQASSSGRRKNKGDLRAEALAKMVEIGRQKLDLLRQMYQHVVATRPNSPSIEVCMTRVYNLVGTSDEQVLAAGDSLLDDKNRQAFMALTDEHAVMWIDRELQMQNFLYKQHFPGL